MRPEPVTALLTTLADPTRRGVYERIARRGEASVSELVRESTVSQPAVSQHLKVLRDAGLVRTRRAGRIVYYRVEPHALAPLIDWLGYYSRFWPARLDDLERLLEETDE